MRRNHEQSDLLDGTTREVLEIFTIPKTVAYITGNREIAFSTEDMREIDSSYIQGKILGRIEWATDLWLYNFRWR